MVTYCSVLNTLVFILILFYGLDLKHVTNTVNRTLDLILIMLMCVSLLFVRLKCTLKLWGLIFRSLSLGVVVIPLLRLFLATLFDRVAVFVCFVLRYFFFFCFLFGSFPYASLRDKNSGPVFRENIATRVPWQNNATH